ncbi:hypothetical protein IEQ34_005243 [Dendrobium chrysotoxum]|uniref:Uncharacterized protein n=1 Tax=Dendrobium chrysotoxum TaxID=161865 RepID=A0AAV7HCD5_DENCH|nr:hypothetical protein IEQ34_005243 [Dendrobium chrysotoxum]
MGDFELELFLDCGDTGAHGSVGEKDQRKMDEGMIGAVTSDAVHDLNRRLAVSDGERSGPERRLEVGVPDNPDRCAGMTKRRT